MLYSAKYFAPQCFNGAASLGKRGEAPTATNSIICGAENGGVKEGVINFS